MAWGESMVVVGGHIFTQRAPFFPFHTPIHFFGCRRDAVSALLGRTRADGNNRLPAARWSLRNVGRGLPSRGSTWGLGLGVHALVDA